MLPTARAGTLPGEGLTIHTYGIDALTSLEDVRHEAEALLGPAGAAEPQ